MLGAATQKAFVFESTITDVGAVSTTKLSTLVAALLHAVALVNFATTAASKPL